MPLPLIVILSNYQTLELRNFVCATTESPLPRLICVCHRECVQLKLWYILSITQKQSRCRLACSRPCTDRGHLAKLVAAAMLTNVETLTPEIFKGAPINVCCAPVSPLTEIWGTHQLKGAGACDLQ